MARNSAAPETGLIGPGLSARADHLQQGPLSLHRAAGPIARRNPSASPRLDQFDDQPKPIGHDRPDIRVERLRPVDQMVQAVDDVHFAWSSLG